MVNTEGKALAQAHPCKAYRVVACKERHTLSICKRVFVPYQEYANSLTNKIILQFFIGKTGARLKLKIMLKSPHIGPVPEKPRLIQLSVAENLVLDPSN